MKLNIYLKTVREHCKMTKEEMSNKLGITVQTYNFLEYGEVLWDTKQFKKIVREIKKEYDESHRT